MTEFLPVKQSNIHQYFQYNSDIPKTLGLIINSLVNPDKILKDVKVTVTGNTLTSGPTELTIEDFPPEKQKLIENELKNDNSNLRLELKKLGWSKAFLSKDLSGKTIIMINEPKKRQDFPQISLDCPIDFITHHNQALVSIDSFNKGEKGKNPLTLLHFDTHSDIDKGEGTKSIGDYINTLIENKTVDKIYWIKPSGLPVSQISEKASKDRIPNSRLDENYELSLYVIDNRISLVKPNDSQEYRTIRMTVCTLDKLPKFSKDNKLWLDVDMDYFSNDGYGTIGAWNNNPDERSLIKNLSKFSRALEEKGIKPEFATICTSPDFTNEEDFKIIHNFFGSGIDKDFMEGIDNYTSSHQSNRADHDLITRKMKGLLISNNKTLSPKLCDDLAYRGLWNLRNSYVDWCNNNSPDFAVRFLETIESSRKSIEAQLYPYK